MPYLKGSHAKATWIHEEYQSGRNDQRAFLWAAREFLQGDRAADVSSSPSLRAPPVPLTVTTAPTPASGTPLSPLESSTLSSLLVQPPPIIDHQPLAPAISTTTTANTNNNNNFMYGNMNPHNSTSPMQQQQHPGMNTGPPPSHGGMFSQQPSQQQQQYQQQQQHHQSQPQSQPDRLEQLLQQQEQFLNQHQQGQQLREESGPPQRPDTNGMIMQQHQQIQQQQLHQQHQQQQQRQGSESFRMDSLEKGLDALLMQDDAIVPMPGNMAAAATAAPSGASIWGARSQVIGGGNNGGGGGGGNGTGSHVPVASSPMRQPGGTVQSPWGSQPAGPNQTQQQKQSPPLQPQPQPSGVRPAQDQYPPGQVQKAGTPSQQKKQPPKSRSKSPPAVVTEPARSVRKEAPPPKRVWSHFDEQPGRILVNGCSGQDSSLVLPLGPREELTAHWSLPLDYIRQHAPRAKSLDQALASLTVGLFRRGCTENGGQASIISKAVLGDNNRSYDYWKDNQSQSICGKVPFYSPRTPGHVLFRMYWDNEPLYTLAMGPTLHVRISEDDFESSVRFILSNFKGKKSNPTSLSSLHSLAHALETTVTRPNESAARVTWGCIQEARKVLEVCAADYTKTSGKLSELEESLEELKKQAEDEDTKSKSSGRSTTDDYETADAADGEESAANAVIRDKTRALLSGRASCERKWRDSQLAFASILRAVVLNSSMSILLRRDLIAKMRIEFELWCPLSEEFAIPNDTAKMWYEPLRDLPNVVTADDFRLYAQARAKMQMRTLCFEPNVMPMEDILFPRNRGSPNQRTMDSGAVTVFNTMSAAMGQFYQDLYAEEDRVVRQRELIRERTEKCVQECGAFPAGTRVVIFGSSANGFGSPKSDLDMCLQLPGGSKLSEDDQTGSIAMGKLAAHFEETGMKSVDAARLTARIPIIMYMCPNPLGSRDGEEELLECDLSMHNPLAVLNTALLRTYAELTPVTRVLASLVKRWAKARDINNPARHTLSSYGYIIMVLHFLTYHKRTGNGLVSTVSPPEGNPQHRNPQTPRPTPLLPNLQWMDPVWPSHPKGTPYRELSSLPRNIVPHPMEDKKTVNRYFNSPKTPEDKAALQSLFSGQDLSLAILLASFFRYYAYEFDYKRYVVSMHSTSSRGLVEREVKAELDGWRNYSAALTIEDPFESFYDIAHVLRGGYYHRIRREFAVAYSKIADAASGRPGAWNKGDLREMTGEELIDWICEPVSSSEKELP
jgi:DNA polymerase sigma